MISIENSDWVCILNQERKADTEELYMTFKLLKRRYRSSEDSKKLRELEYFNHPYEPDNSICLIDDINLPKSLSLYGLASQFLPMDDGSKRGKKNATDRPKEKKREQNDFDSIFEPFDADNSDYL